MTKIHSLDPQHLFRPLSCSEDPLLDPQHSFCRAVLRPLIHRRRLKHTYPRQNGLWSHTLCFITLQGPR